MGSIMQFIIYRHNHASCQSLAKEKRCCRRENMVRFGGGGPRAVIIPGFSGQIGVPRSTLNEEVSGGKSRRKAHEKEQILPQAIENALEMWVQKREDHGFLRRLEISRQWHRSLRNKCRTEGGFQAWEDLVGKLSQPSLQCFLEVRIQFGPLTCIGR